MKCRKAIRRCQNRGLTHPPGSVRENPEACPSGIRHGGGAKLNRALVWNVRTCRTDAKEEVSSGQNRDDESTDAEHRGGAARIRDEGSVMELDRRGLAARASELGTVKRRTPKRTLTVSGPGVRIPSGAPIPYKTANPCRGGCPASNH